MCDRLVKVPAPTVLVCDANETRADLYSLWLERFETRKALTKSQFADEIDARVAVAVIDQTLCGEETAAVLDLVGERAPFCRTVGTRDRSTAFPHSGFDEDFVRPVFEADLTESVTSLFCRANYERLIRHYYRSTVALSSFEWRTADDDVEDERYDRLRERAVRLRRLLKALRVHMSDEDVRTVMRSVSVGDIKGIDETESLDSKYRPSGCSNCGQDWSEPVDGDEPTKRLGAFVWRCASCGHVQMYADPSHRRIGSYR